MSKVLPVVTVTLNPAIDQTLSIPGFAAGQVNRVAESRSHAGGKGVNVACFLADLGVESGIEVIATGFLGSENAGLFEAAFAQRNISDRFVRLPGCTRVGIKIVDGWTHETTDINFPGLRPERKDIDQLFDGIAALAAPGRWFVLSGSVPAGAPHGIYAGLIQLIHEKGGRVMLDTSGRPLRAALANAPDVVKPNVDELRELMARTLNIPGKAPAAVHAAAQSLLDRGIGRVVVSMGGDGAVFVDRGQALLARPPKVTVRSTVGAGDAMVAGIVYATIHDSSLADLARTATASGAYAVTRVGPGIEDRAALESLKEQVEIETLS
jgi:1-phosphofructokinase